MNPWTTRVEKTVVVTITLDGTGSACFDFLEPESCDDFRIVTSIKNSAEEELRIGRELLSWLPLMADEVEEIMTEGKENEE